MDVSSLEGEMAESGVQDVETYVSCRHNTIANFIATRPVMDLSRDDTSTSCPGSDAAYAL